MKPSEKKVAMGILIFIAAMWLLYPYLLLWLFSPNATLVKLGPFGDLYGGLNTLFSGLALAGLIFNIHLQRINFEHISEQERVNKELILQQSQIMATTSLAQYYADQETELIEILGNSNFILDDPENPINDPTVSKLIKTIEDAQEMKNKYLEKLIEISEGQKSH